MRLEAKIKSGFYPLQTRWIEPIAARIKCSPKATLFDPCCGTGEAVHLLGKSLGLHENNVYGSELDERRSEQAAKLLAPGKVTGNVDFLGSSAWGEASVVYCNPPFDDELGGGGRVEWRFAINAISCLKVGGVFVGIFPDRVAVSSEMYQVLSQKLERILCFELPGERPYEECVIFGTKLKTEIPSQYRRAIARDWDDWSDLPYDAPDGGPVHVRKHFYTDQEMEVLAGKSPANSLLVSKAKASRTEFAPPMALTRGHVALLLASGCLDLGFKLPGFAEFLEPITMDSEVADCYERLESEIRSNIKNLLRMGSKGALSAMLNTLNGWPDHPYGFGEVGYRNEEGKWTTVARPPELDPNVIRPKERRLVEVVKDIVKRGRQAWVYAEMTGKHDVLARLEKLLTDQGLKVHVMRSKSVKPCDREEWIFKHGKDADVIISNPALVQTGFDLFDRGGNHNFSSLVFYQSGYKLDTIRQAAARAWRIGQTLDCEVFYLFYAATMQQSVMTLMSAKTQAAQAVEGKFSNAGLAAMAGGDGDSAAMMLAKMLVDKPVVNKLAIAKDEAYAKLRASIDTIVPEIASVEPAIPAKVVRKSKSDPLAKLLTYPDQIREEISLEAQGLLNYGWATWRLKRMKTYVSKLEIQDQSRFWAIVDLERLESEVVDHVRSTTRWKHCRLMCLPSR